MILSRVLARRHILGKVNINSAGASQYQSRPQWASTQPTTGCFLHSTPQKTYLTISLHTIRHFIAHRLRLGLLETIEVHTTVHSSIIYLTTLTTVRVKVHANHYLPLSHACSIPTQHHNINLMIPINLTLTHYRWKTHYLVRC